MTILLGITSDISNEICDEVGNSNFAPRGKSEDWGKKEKSLDNKMDENLTKICGGNSWIWLFSITWI